MLSGMLSSICGLELVLPDFAKCPLEAESPVVENR